MPPSVPPLALRDHPGSTCTTSEIADRGPDADVGRRQTDAQWALSLLSSPGPLAVVKTWRRDQKASRPPTQVAPLCRVPPNPLGPQFANSDSRAIPDPYLVSILYLSTRRPFAFCSTGCTRVSARPPQSDLLTLIRGCFCRQCILVPHRTHTYGVMLEYVPSHRVLVRRSFPRQRPLPPPHDG